MRRRPAAAFAAAAASLAIAACRPTPITRNGPPQERISSRTYPVPVNDLRARIVERYPAFRAGSDAFRALELTGQPPPGYSTNWFVGYVDPGGFFKPYVDLSDSARALDLVLQDAIGDSYWTSEYETTHGPVPFRCTLILHFVPRSATETELQVFELVPTVWVGQHWVMMVKEGVGPGRARDIRFVEPTVRDRRAVLDFVDSILK
jgi:hypothetical protein